MIGINWELVGGDSIPLPSLFSDADLARLNAALPKDRSIADRLMIWNPTSDSYTTYFLRKNATAVLGWGDYNASNAALATEDIKIEKGSAMWFYRAATDDITVTLKGQVADDSIFPHVIAGKDNCTGYTMIAAGFPRDIMLNAIQFGWTTGVAALPKDRSTADQIMIWNPADNTYTTYFLRRNATTVLGWGDYNASNAAIVDDAKIPAGGAAWYYHPVAEELTISEATPIPAN